MNEEFDHEAHKSCINQRVLSVPVQKSPKVLQNLLVSETPDIIPIQLLNRSFSSKVTNETGIKPLKKQVKGSSSWRSGFHWTRLIWADHSIAVGSQKFSFWSACLHEPADVSFGPERSGSEERWSLNCRGFEDDAEPEGQWLETRRAAGLWISWWLYRWRPEGLNQFPGVCWSLLVVVVSFSDHQMRQRRLCPLVDLRTSFDQRSDQPGGAAGVQVRCCLSRYGVQ